MDTNSINKLNQLHPKLKDSAITAYNECVKSTPSNIHPYIVQTFRSFKESDDLYKLGRTVVNPDGKNPSKPFGNIVTNSKGGESYHNFSIALDFGIMIDNKPDYNEKNPYFLKCVEIFKSHQFSWGGDFSGSFKDYPHMENRFGYNWRQLLEKHNNKDFIPGTEFVNI